MQKIFGIIGWIGTALVFGAVGVRMFYPEWNQYATYAATPSSGSIKFARVNMLLKPLVSILKSGVVFGKLLKENQRALKARLV